MSDPNLNRPEPPRRPPDLVREPVQIDPLLNEGRPGPMTITLAVTGTAAIVLLLLFGIGNQSDRQTAHAPAQPAATGPSTTGQGSPPRTSAIQQDDQDNRRGAAPEGGAVPPTSSGNAGQARPIPQEQDSIEQNTRP
jgi:hypothetical protein